MHLVVDEYLQSNEHSFSHGS